MKTGYERSSVMIKQNKQEEINSYKYINEKKYALFIERKKNKEKKLN